MTEKLIRRLQCWWKVWVTPTEKKKILSLQQSFTCLIRERDELYARIHQQDADLAKQDEQIADLTGARAELRDRLTDATFILARKEDILAKIRELVGG